MKELKQIYKKIGQQIRNIRKAKKMTLEDLSFKINMDYSFLARVETGKAVPSIESLYRISKGLNIELFQFFDNTEIKKAKSVKNELNAIIKNLSDDEESRILSVIKLFLYR